MSTARFASNGSPAACPDVAAVTRVLDAHSNLVLAARELYAQDVTWVAPVRDLRLHGRDDVVQHQLREAAAMRNAEFTFLRRNSNDRQVIDEFAVRFEYSGEGIEKTALRTGDLVELKRVRILDLDAGRISRETCIEQWTVLKPAG